MKKVLKSIGAAILCIFCILCLLTSIGLYRLEAEYDFYCEQYVREGKVELVGNPINKENFDYMCD